MKRLRFLLSSLALFVGLTIAGISFSAATSGEAYSENDHSASSKKLYLNQKLLPDHLFYPVVAATDRTRLELATPIDRIYLQVQYGQRRFLYTKELLEKGHRSLALSTLTKSQKYFIIAAQEYLDQDLANSVGRFLVRAINYHLDQIGQIKSELNPQEVDVIEKLCQENRILKEKIEKEIE
jgi:hypothetical protein